MSRARPGARLHQSAPVSAIASDSNDDSTAMTNVFSNPARTLGSFTAWLYQCPVAPVHEVSSELVSNEPMNTTTNGSHRNAITSALSTAPTGGRRRFTGL